MNKLKQFKEVSKQLSILFVEDDDTLRHTTKELLSGLFKQTIVAADGVIGLECYEVYYDENEAYFDVVVTDIQMPNMNGISLSKEIFKINKNQKIIVISAYDDKKYFIELINMGVTGFIQKPLLSKQLFSTLSKVCNEIAEEKELSRFLDFENSFKWDSKNNILYQNKLEINLSKNEIITLELLISNPQQSFTSLEIFDYIYKDNFDKEFSPDAIKSLIKRLRKKAPMLITTTSELGYKLNT